MKRSPVSGLNCPSRIAPASASRPSWCSCRPRQISKMRIPQPFRSRWAAAMPSAARRSESSTWSSTVRVSQRHSWARRSRAQSVVPMPALRRLLGHLERVLVAPVDIGGDGLGERERERRVGIPARLHGRGRLGVDRLRLLGAAADEQVVEERGEVAGAQRARAARAARAPVGPRRPARRAGRGTCPRCPGAPRPPAPPAARRADACRRTRAPRRRGPRNGAGRRSGRGAARAGRGRAAPAPARAG